MIIGRDLLDELGMKFLFSENLSEWDNAITPMLDPDMFCEQFINELEHEILYMHDPDTTEAERVQLILNAKYCRADLNKLVKECEQLSKDGQDKL